MEIKTRKFKLALSLLATQVDEVTIRPDADGWNVRAVDPSHTSMIAAKIPSQAFTAYKQNEDFAISLKNILKVMANFGENTDVIVNEGTIEFSSDGMTARFPLIVPTESDPKIPEIPYDAGLTVEIGEITRIGPAVASDMEAYVLKIENEVFTISAEDESKNGVRVSIPASKCLNINGTAKSMFAIDMLDRFVKILPKDCVVDLNIGTDVPLTLDIRDDALEVRYLLAPRIDNQE